jgi:hypothetical protein
VPGHREHESRGRRPRRARAPARRRHRRAPGPGARWFTTATMPIFGELAVSGKVPGQHEHEPRGRHPRCARAPARRARRGSCPRPAATRPRIPTTEGSVLGRADLAMLDEDGAQGRRRGRGRPKRPDDEPRRAERLAVSTVAPSLLSAKGGGGRERHLARASQSSGRRSSLQTSEANPRETGLRRGPGPGTCWGINTT